MDGENSPAPVAETFSIVDIDSNGVDRAQIRRQLKLTPFERLRSLESFLASVVRIRRGIRGARVSRDPAAISYIQLTIDEIDEIEREGG